MKAKLPTLTVLILATGMFCTFCVSTSFAQTPSDPPPSEQTETDGQAAAATSPGDKTFLQTLAAGGWAMYPLGFLSVAMVTLIIFNFVALRESNFIQEETVDSLQNHLDEGDVGGAIDICNENTSPVAAIFGHGLKQVRGDQVDPDAVEKAIEASSTKELAGNFVMINYLSIVAAIAPMLGLLGTVSGMVKAFNSIASQGMGKPELLADNISEALVTTATGMVIGIPAMFFFFYFKNRYGKLVAEITLIVGDLYNGMMNGLRRSS